ncbi:MAG TPA: M23 family metallopeptidase [Gemmatimonadales bacterium]|nr:M23 family metallopeptidase [Gemmatimonadales bacterium]
MRAPLSALALVLAAAPGLAAQLPQGVVVGTTPDVPGRGTVAWLRVTADSAPPSDSLTAVDGEIEGEPLHFEPRRAGGYRALLPIPLEGGDTLALRLILHRESRSDTADVPLTVAREAYPRERLKVAPRMARPDSASEIRVEREVAQARAIGRASHGTPSLWVGPFRLPRPSRITSRFGAAREFNGEVTSRHLGTDFAGKVGAPVSAPARGVVALVADFYLAGHALYLDHGGGLVTGYFHLSRTLVAPGDTVLPGQPIGEVGRTGRVTGPHLHWIARYGTINVDAMSLVDLPW